MLLLDKMVDIRNIPICPKCRKRADRAMSELRVRKLWVEIQCHAKLFEFQIDMLELRNANMPYLVQTKFAELVTGGKLTRVSENGNASAEPLAITGERKIKL